MPRKKRKKLKFTEDSLNDLLQEIYDDSHNIRAKITRLFNKWEKQAKEGGEIAAFGDSIVKLINAESKNQDQKIMLLKYLKEVVFADNADKPTDKAEITDDTKNELMKIVANEVAAKDKAAKDKLN
jgi:membrane-bound lytic murein transglycosylase